MEDKLKKIVDKYVNKYMKKFDRDFPKAANYACDEMYKEAWKMYDSFIDQYYSYKTTSYIRHGESKPGTGRGINLYRASKIEQRGRNTNNPSLIIKFSAEDMEDTRYEYDSADFVLENVMEGYRGVPGFWVVPWEGTYDGEYFQYSGSPKKAFDIFNEQFDNIMQPIFFKKWRELGWK